MKAASRVANGSFDRLGRQLQPAEIKVGKAEPNQPKRSDVSARNECHETGGFLIKVRQSPFEVKSCLFELAEVQTGGAGLVVANHHARPVDAAAQEWLGHHPDLHIPLPDPALNS